MYCLHVAVYIATSAACGSSELIPGGDGSLAAMTLKKKNIAGYDGNSFIIARMVAYAPLYYLELFRPGVPCVSV
jgi:hypothetical protein